jgi:hypothetical protein
MTAITEHGFLNLALAVGRTVRVLFQKHTLLPRIRDRATVGLCYLGWRTQPASWITRDA